MELTDYVAALRKRWIILVIVALLGAGAGLAMARTTAPAYRSTTKVFVSLAHGETVGELVQGTLYTQNLVESFAQLSTTPAVLDPVIERLGLDVTSKTLGRSVSADAPLNTMFVEISATSSDPRRAATIADAVAAQLATTVRDIAPSGAAGTDTVRMSVVSPAEPAKAPFTPNTKLSVMTGGAVGAVLGVAVVLALTLLDTRVRSAKDVPRTPERVILGMVPRDRGAARRRTPSLLLNPHGSVAESYRRVQTNLQFLGAAGALRTIVVTSAIPREGRSTTSINLAIAIAEKGNRVLLVDADLRRPSLAHECDIESAVGLTTILIGEATLEDLAQPWGAAGLDVLVAGEVPPNPAQLIDSDAMGELLAEATERYDFVILDTPPLLAVADAAVLARHSDGAVVVAGCSQVRRTQLAAALSALDTVGAVCLGVVLNAIASTEEHPYTYVATAQRRTSWWRRRRSSVRRRRGAPVPAVARPTGAATGARTTVVGRDRRRGNHVSDVSAADAVNAVSDASASDVIVVDDRADGGAGVAEGVLADSDTTAGASAEVTLPIGSSAPTAESPAEASAAAAPDDTGTDPATATTVPSRAGRS